MEYLGIKPLLYVQEKVFPRFVRFDLVAHPEKQHRHQPFRAMIGRNMASRSYVHSALEQAQAGREPAQMDAILLIMFGALFSMTSALTFMEVRRIRKKLESK
jgi:hypothetical protein